MTDTIGLRINKFSHHRGTETSYMPFHRIWLLVVNLIEMNLIFGHQMDWDIPSSSSSGLPSICHGQRLYRWKRGVPGCAEGEELRETEGKDTDDVGVKDNLLHHMCMVGYEKIYAMLEIVIKICGERKSLNMTVRYKQTTCKMAPDFHPRYGLARG